MAIQATSLESSEPPHLAQNNYSSHKIRVLFFCIIFITAAVMVGFIFYTDTAKTPSLPQNNTPQLTPVVPSQSVGSVQPIVHPHTDTLLQGSSRK